MKNTKKSLNQRISEGVTLHAERIIKENKDNFIKVSNVSQYIDESFDFNKDVDIGQHKHLLDFSFDGTTNKFTHLVKELYPCYDIVNSGGFYYPPTGYMSWHTNSNKPCKRVYLVYADEDNKSFFRWKDPVTNEIVTSYDNKGLTIREFDVTGQAPYLWHCIYSDCNRVSFGFRLHDTRNGK
jgi:hypothetical protein